MASSYFFDSSGDERSDDDPPIRPIRLIKPSLFPGKETIRVDKTALIPGKRYTFYHTPFHASAWNLYKFRATFNKYLGNSPDPRGWILISENKEKIRPDGSRAPDDPLQTKISMPLDSINYVTEISFDKKEGEPVVPDDVTGKINSFFGGKKVKKPKTQKRKKAGRRSRLSVKRIKRSKH